MSPTPRKVAPKWPTTPPTPKRDARGRWYVRPYLGTDHATGRKVRPRHNLAATTREDAEREGRAWWERMTGRESLGDYLARWIRDTPLAPSTARAYGVSLTQVLRTPAAALDVRDVTPADLDGLARDLAAHGGRDGNALAVSQVKTALGMVGAAYIDAARAGTVAGTPYLGTADHIAHGLALARLEPAHGGASGGAKGAHENESGRKTTAQQTRTNYQEQGGEGAASAIGAGD